MKKTGYLSKSFWSFFKETLNSWKDILRPGGRIYVQSGNIRNPGASKGCWIIDESVIKINEEAIKIVSSDKRFEAYKDVLEDGPYMKAHDDLREKSHNSVDGSSYDFMPRDLDNKGFIYNIFSRNFDDGGGDTGDLLTQGYSTHAMRAIMGLGTTPSMDVKKPLKDVYETPDHIQKARDAGPK